MMLQMQLAIFFFSTLILTLRSSTSPSLTSTITTSYANNRKSCLEYAPSNTLFKLNNHHSINLLSITTGDMSECSSLIPGITAVIKQYDFVSAALLIQNRKIILSPTDNVGIGQIFDGTYDTDDCVFILGKSSFKNATHLEKKLRELFFYGACHHYQLVYDKESKNRSAFRTTAEKEKLLTALDEGYKAVKAYNAKFKHYDKKNDGKHRLFKRSIKEQQSHYTYPGNTDLLGNLIYKDVDPARAALIETETMFIPDWINQLSQVYGENHALTVRIGLLYAEIPAAIIDMFFPTIKKHVDEMTLTIFNNYQPDQFSASNELLSLDEAISNINERASRKYGFG